MERRIITILGCVQGVGFRPFVFRLAHRHDLKGGISNTTSGVVIDVQGKESSLSLFQKDLVLEKPKGAKISEINAISATPLIDVNCFHIKQSLQEKDTALALLPDTAMCGECLQELFDPHNRRFQYPFLHCITCGPRFSLFLSMPFDRGNTTMSFFNMCKECNREYGDPENRRFYSQTNCCPNCGPSLKLLNSKGELIADKNDTISLAVEFLRKGKIIGAKSTGGYQLLVDATNETAVKRLRLLKQRAGKPFALLMPSIDPIREVAEVCQAAEEVLVSPAAPIVLVRKKGGVHHIAPSVTKDSPYYGVMLPHNGIQHLLLKALNHPLVATSGNISGSPLCITEEEALSQLSPLVDAFLIHNRQIMHRLDDSIVHIIDNKPIMMRRARGYIPYAIPIPEYFDPLKTAVLAAGSQQKCSFAFIKKNQIYMGQHIGDLESANTCKAYDQEVEKWEKLLAIKPQEGIADKHPDFYAYHYLQRRNMLKAHIQHHQAHVWSGMIDNLLKPPFFSISWDGTGWGDDGTIWGGEAFVVEKEGMCRVASLYPFRLPGGEKAIREPRRSGLGALYAIADGKFSHAFEQWLSKVFNREELSILLNALSKKIHAPLCSSIGRLFDGVSALLGCSEMSDFEGEAALILEAMAHQAKDKEPKRYSIQLLKENMLWLMDWRSMVVKIMEDKKSMAISEISWSFHEALAECIVNLARLAAQENVLLTGGVMQNKLLTELAIEKLQKGGFTPYLHRNIPPNDGGLAVGQAIGKLKFKITEDKYVPCTAR